MQRSGAGRTDRDRRRRLEHERSSVGGVFPEHPSPNPRDRLSEDDRRGSEERLHSGVLRVRHCVQDLLGADREHLRGRAVCAEVLPLRASDGSLGVAHHDGVRVRDASQLRVHRRGDLGEEKVGEADHAGGGGADRGAIEAGEELRRDSAARGTDRVHPRDGISDRRAERRDRIGLHRAECDRESSEGGVESAVRVSAAVAARSADAGSRFARQCEGVADRDGEVHRELRGEGAGGAEEAGCVQRIVQCAVPLLRVRGKMRTAVVLRHQLLLRSGVQRRRADSRGTERHDVHHQQPGCPGGRVDRWRRARHHDDEHRAQERKGRAGDQKGAGGAGRTALQALCGTVARVETGRLLQLPWSHPVHWTCCQYRQPDLSVRY